MQKVIHLIPYDCIGGVETAARSMVGVKHQQIDFQVNYVYRKAGSKGQRLSTFNPLQLMRATFRILARKPDLLIVSLWRPCIVGILVKLVRPRLPMVLFLHSTNHAHWVDRCITRLTGWMATQIWADSERTLFRRMPESSSATGQVISFVTQHLPVTEGGLATPVFIFWGRIHPVKGLDRALGIFAAVVAVRPAARFLIIGPDGGDLVRIERLANEMGLSASVSFLGGMDFTSIRQHAEKASFYLQTSQLEGMAMSVVEAMQLGLVPVVTPVGEIGNYCRHGENALLINSATDVVSEILPMLEDNTKYMHLRNNAVATWADRPLYSESVLQACVAILSTDSGISARST